MEEVRHCTRRDVDAVESSFLIELQVTRPVGSTLYGNFLLRYRPEEFLQGINLGEIG